MLRMITLAGAVALGIASMGAVGCGSSESDLPEGPSFAGSPVREGALLLPARVEGEEISLGMGDRFEPRFWPGVNLGPTVPGTFPGELAGTRADFDRWLEEMGELGVRLLRVYTILPPDFYKAFKAYNEANEDRPIHLLHGVWIPEEEFLTTQDAWPLLDEWKAEIKDVVDVVHGDAVIPDKPGHASGTYTADISKWLMGWAVGVEWDPAASVATDEKHRGMEPFRGRYVRATAGATPMENWIASGMDYLAGLEADRGWSRPMTFTNWLTTDPLRHPLEPNPNEDRLSIDAMHMRATGAWPGGLFASYHVYPYYPDFLRYEYEDAVAADGSPDPYAGYLRALSEHHRGEPVMVTEFGVPTSFGMAHVGPLGRNQGGHSEQEAGEINATLLRRIQEEGFAGGIIFEWTDEWFKFTWNTMDLEMPDDRRALWRNSLTNEEHFGLLAVEPGREPVKVLDGKDDDWKPDNSQVIAESRGPVREVRATHDAQFLWLRLKLDQPELWNEETIRIGLSVTDDGNGGLPGTDGADPEADVGVVIGPGEKATLLQAAWLDPLPWLYGQSYNYVPFDEEAMKRGSGAWVKPRQILNRPLMVPGRGMQPAEFYDISSLPWGNGDPESENFDQRSLINGTGDVLEIRLPWMMVGFADPSSHQVLRGQRDKPMTTETTGPVGITVQAGEELLKTNGYGWDEWNLVEWHERRKAGWDAVRAEMAESAAAGPVPRP